MSIDKTNKDKVKKNGIKGLDMAYQAKVLPVAAGGTNFAVKPAFLAYLASTASNKTGNGTTYTLGTDALTEVFDAGGDFNTNGTFTAPVTGKYHLSATIYFTGCTIASSFSITMTTSNRIYTKSFGKAAGNQDESMSIDALCDMDAADTAVISCSVVGEGADTVDIYGSANCNTFFSGFLAC